MRKPLTASELTLTRQGPVGERSLRITASPACRSLEKYEQEAVLLALYDSEVCQNGTKIEGVFKYTRTRPKQYVMCVVPLCCEQDEQVLADTCRRTIEMVLQGLEEAHSGTEGRSRFDRVYINYPSSRALRRVGQVH